MESIVCQIQNAMCESASLLLGMAAATSLLWIAPGLAFNASGGRLGYGGGWYDRLLTSAGPEAVFLGVASPFQVVEAVPSEPHDIRLTDVVVAACGCGR